VNKKYIIIGLIVIVVAGFFLLRPRQNLPIQAREPSSPEVQAMYQQAVKLKKNREMLKSKMVYQEIVKNHPDAENIASIQGELEILNMNIIFSGVEVPEKTAVHEVVAGDTLGKIARKFGTTVEFIKRSNNLKSDVIRIGQKLRIWTGQFNIVVDKSQNILILKDGNEVVKVYSVSTGSNNSTPVGKYTVTTKLIDPVWFNRGVVVPPESPQNVLGTRWLGFDLPGYGIHGTVNPDSIGQQVTAGCVRMRNLEVEELYMIVPKGTEVVIVD